MMITCNVVHGNNLISIRDVLALIFLALILLLIIPGGKRGKKTTENADEEDPVHWI